MKVYCAHPISGQSYDQVVDYYSKTISVIFETSEEDCEYLYKLAHGDI